MVDTKRFDAEDPGTGLRGALVRIDWDKSPEPTAWSSAEAAYEVEVDSCISVGFVMRDDWDTTVLAPTVAGWDEGEELQVAGVIRIPTGAIRSVRRLVVGE